MSYNREGEGIEVRVYVRPDGAAPYSVWLEGLTDREAVARIRVRLARLRLGNPGDWRAVGGGVRELRIDLGPGYRVYLGMRGPRMAVLLWGGTKSGQERDIRLARRYWSDHAQRTREG